MNILAQLLFNWIFAALSAGQPPAQFNTAGQYVGPDHASNHFVSRLK